MQLNLGPDIWARIQRNYSTSRRERRTVSSTSTSTRCSCPARRCLAEKRLLALYDEKIVIVSLHFLQLHHAKPGAWLARSI